MRKVHYRTVPGTKLCPNCLRVKPLEFFNGGYCADCYRVYHKEWTKKNRSATISRARAEAVAHYGGKCSECDQTDPEVMKIYPTQGKGQRWIIEYLKSHDFPDGYYPLCANCDARRRYKK